MKSFFILVKKKQIVYGEYVSITYLSGCDITWFSIFRILDRARPKMWAIPHLAIHYVVLGYIFNEFIGCSLDRFSIPTVKNSVQI